VIDAERDDKQFRRGVVLGLTMAEILLLLIFVLMLLLAAKLQASNEREQTNMRERDEARTALVAAEVLVEQLEKAAGDKIDIMKDYIRVEQELAEARKKLEDTRDGALLVEEAKRMAPDVTIEQAIQQMVSAARLGDALSKTDADPSKLLESAASCKAELQNCQGQAAYLNDRLNDKTGGRGMPPCWVTEEGKIEYIFDAHLREEGIVLIDNKLPHRAQEQALLPIQGVKFDSPLEVSAFRSSVGPLKQWSEKREPECRFYVNLFDDTGANAKPRYKALRRGVEDYFYIRIAD
jgi:hypothetical protein